MASKRKTFREILLGTTHRVIDWVSDKFNGFVRYVKGGIQSGDESLCRAGGIFQDEAQAETEALKQELKNSVKEVAKSAVNVLGSLFQAHLKTLKGMKYSVWDAWKAGKISLKDALYGSVAFVLGEVFKIDLEKISGKVLPTDLMTVVYVALFAGFVVVTVMNWMPVFEAVRRFGRALVRLRRAILARLGWYVINPRPPVPGLTPNWLRRMVSAAKTRVEGYVARGKPVAP